MLKPNWTDIFLHLLALASKLEGEGQYNIAKLTRAAADSLSRRAAWELDLPSDKASLAREVERSAALLDDADLATALRKGAFALIEGQLPLIHETPHPYVCRTCGHLTLAAPPEKCPDCGAWGGTFQWFPPVYWLEALDPPAALERLRQTPLEGDSLLEGLSEEAMTHQPVDGGWGIRIIVSHM